MPSNHSPRLSVGALACIVFLPSLTTTKIMAATITFEDIPPPGLELTSYTEEGFTITSITGRWTLGVVGGPLIPARSVLASGPVIDCPIPPGPPCGSGTDVVELTLTAEGEFTFTEFDLHSIGGSVVYSVLGFNGGVPVLSQSDHVFFQFPFALPVTVGIANSSTPLTSVQIALTPGTVGLTAAYNLDNIVVSAVPEPNVSPIIAVLILIGFGVSRFRSLRLGQAAAKSDGESALAQRG